MSSGTTFVKRHTEAFLEFMQGYYDRHYRDTPIHETSVKDRNFWWVEFKVVRNLPLYTESRSRRTRWRRNVIEETKETPGTVKQMPLSESFWCATHPCALRSGGQLPETDVDPHRCGIGCLDVPLQEAVNFVSYLVLVQAG